MRTYEYTCPDGRFVIIGKRKANPVPIEKIERLENEIKGAVDEAFLDKSIDRNSYGPQYWYVVDIANKWADESPEVLLEKLKERIKDHRNDELFGLPQYYDRFVDHLTRYVYGDADAIALKPVLIKLQRKLIKSKMETVVYDLDILARESVVKYANTKMLEPEEIKIRTKVLEKLGKVLGENFVVAKPKKELIPAKEAIDEFFKKTRK